MLNFNASFRWGPNGGPRGMIERRKQVAHAALDAVVIKDTNPYVPMLTGMLASSPMRSRTVGRIVYDTPYARRLYYGRNFNFTKAFNPQAGAFWFKRAKPVWFQKWRNLVDRILKGHNVY